MKPMAELGLGTVQWGLPYGIANHAGQTSVDEVGNILNVARAQGVRLLDTASLYGEAEAVLGRHDLDGLSIVSKTPRYEGAEITQDHARHLYATFRQSLVRLRCDRLYGLLIHHAADLLAPGGPILWAEMSRLKADGLVDKIGVSIYDGQQLDALLKNFRPDIVQLPLSVLDQRLVCSGHLDRLQSLEVEVHVRSVFLQGLLLMPLDRLPSYFQPIRPLLMRWHDAAARQGMSLTQAALSYVRHLPGVDVLLVGVENVAQLSASHADFSVDRRFDASGLACDDPAFVNPVHWKVKQT